MRFSLVLNRSIALLIAHALFLSPFVFAQEPQQQTRPRRAETSSQPANAPSVISQTGTTRLTEEPTIRIGLATDARAVSISTNSQLLNASDTHSAPTPLNVARVRIEAHLLSPVPLPAEPDACFVQLAGFPTRVDAEKTLQEVRALTGEQAECVYDAATKSWPVRVGTGRSRPEAEELRATLEEAGFVKASIIETHAAHPSVQAPSTSSAKNRSGASSQSTARLITSSNVRAVSRTSSPSRELVAYAAGSNMLFNSSAPVVFASEDERNAPVRFNDKPYRGRLEVFANPRGALTVVNVVGLEDYVCGVVPNELSPGGYPAIEALKAQAVAARTYAVKNRGQFAAQGFDLLPTTRSQVYGGLATEHSLSTRAVVETRGIVATYNGEPINALYTSTCGGRTENAENIFGEAVPYLRGRECSPEGKASFAPFTINSKRELADIRDERNADLARDSALLNINHFALSPSRITDSWLSSPMTIAEARMWIAAVASLTRQSAPSVTEDATRAPAFSTALVAAVYGDARADTLFDNADVDYLLSFRDASEIPTPNRADVALLLRDGYLSLYTDATLRPREQMTRARALHTISRLLESRSLLQLQHAVARPASGGTLVLRSNKNRDQPIKVSEDAFLFRAFGVGVYQMRSVVLVGGEPVAFHLDARGDVDYIEVRPAPNGAASDRFSPFANWTQELSVYEAQSRLARYIGGFGSLMDLRVDQRGSSRRATDLEIVGTNGTTHLHGGRIRSALGLREQLFVIDRHYDASGRVTSFTFTGRGWGHGVGMCQVGAYGLARAGWTYDKILKAYYTGIDLTKMY
ncbi:MAG: SpoIID/LytB domain-containing protein [Pyrinomonadaceae bacterium]